GSVANAITFNSSGTGASSGQTFNCSSAVTISYNTIGAQVAGNYATFGYLFPNQLGGGNATSSLVGFSGGILATASSTIGNGNQNGGLTISGGATTTGNAYFAGNVAVGTLPVLNYA